MRKTISLISISFLLLGISLPVYASSLPEAEITNKIGIGTGPSISADFRVAPKVSLGASFGSPFYRGLFTSGLYDVRLLYKFIDQGKLAFSGVVGVTGSPSFNRLPGFPFGGEAGIALSYQFLPQLTGKLNLVGAFPFGGGPAGLWWGFVSPASGIELGYKFNPNLEISIGGNGQGDVLGLNIYF